jgi:hypothetical protein
LTGSVRCRWPPETKKNLAQQSADDTLIALTRNKQILAAVKTGCPDHHQWLANVIQYAHRRSYVSRVRELLRDTSHLMAAIVGDEKAWTQQLRDIRDGIGHVLPSQDAKTFHQVVAMLYSGQLFAELVLLRQLGFTDAQCRRSIEHHWERQNVRALVEKGFPEWFTVGPVPKESV